MDAALTPWLNLGVSGAFLAIAWVIVTQQLPKAFDRTFQEFSAQRAEFLDALKMERESRLEDREQFLAALGQQRASSDHQLAVTTAAIQRMEAKLEAAMIHLTTQMTHLAGAVNLLLKKEEEGR